MSPSLDQRLFLLEPCAEPRESSRAGPLLLSLAGHAALAVALVLMRGAPAPRAVAGPSRAILLAPLPPPASRPAPPGRATLPKTRGVTASPKPVAPPEVSRPARVFEPPPVAEPLQGARSNSVAPIDVPLSVELPLRPAPASDVHLPVLPAPVFKTDNLAPVGRRADGPAPGRIESTDFRAAVIDKPSMRRDIAGAPGGFASVRAADRASAATGQVATGGFGAPTIGTPEPPPPTTSRGAFGDASVTTPRASVPAVAPAAETPVEILEKPRPAYTEEARRVGLEGEVLLEVLFPASGPARAVRVVRGLGHGLDENAIAAAEAIRFRPATRGGRPVDATATVHIVFQIAF